MKTVVGLFDRNQDAEAAIRELESAGFDKNQVSVFAGRTEQSSAVGTSGEAADSGVGDGAVTGAAVGGGVGLLAGAALAMIPGVGPVLAIGPLAAAITGMGLGAVAGGVVGALSSAGVPEEHARYYVEGVRRGGTLVTMTCDDDDAPQAMSIMNRHQPVDIDQRSREWKDNGWTGAGSQDLSPDVKRSPALSQYHDRSPSFAADRMDDTPVSTSPPGAGGQTSWDEFGARTEVPAAAAAMEHQRLPSDPQPDHFNRDTTDQVRVPTVAENFEVGKREVEPAGVRIHTERFGGEDEGFEEFRANYGSSHPGQEASFDEYKPAYHFGQDLARDGGGRDWSNVEPEAKQRWGERNPGQEGAWDKMRDACRYGYDRARSKVNS